MSLEELTADYNAIQAKLDALGGLTTSSDIVDLLKNEIGPFLGSFVKEAIEIDETVGELYTQSDDILQPETAGLFATLIMTGRVLMSELEKRAVGDPRLMASIKAWKDISKTCETTLEEITVPDEEEDEDEDLDDPEDPEDDKEKK